MRTCIACYTGQKNMRHIVANRSKQEKFVKVGQIESTLNSKVARYDFGIKF